MTKWFRMMFAFVLVFMFGVMMTSAQTEDGGELTDGEEVTIEVDGVDEIEFTYEGSEGDVITVVVSADDDTDTRLTLLDPDGDEVASDDFSGPGFNPALIRIQLEDDGEYTLVLAHWNEEELDDEFEITLFEVDLLDLNEGPQSTVLGDDFEIDRFVFEAEEDVTYAIFVSADDELDSTLYVDVLEEDDFFADVRVSFSGSDSFVFVFEPSDDGLLTIELDYSSFDNDEIEFTVEIVEQ